LGDEVVSKAAVPNLQTKKRLVALIFCREQVKLDVYGKRQTGKNEIEIVCICKCCYSIFVRFIYGLEEKNSKSEVIFAVCRLPLKSCLTSLLDHWIMQYKTFHWLGHRGYDQIGHV